MHIIIVTHDNSLSVLGATSVIPAERYSSPYLFTGIFYEPTNPTSITDD